MAEKTKAKAAKEDGRDKKHGKAPDRSPSPPANPIAGHGAEQLPSVIVDAYNCEVRDSEGFLGDRANKKAFWALVDDWRKRMREVGDDPLGDTPTVQLGKKQLDQLLKDGPAEAAGLIHTAVEEFAQQLAEIIERFLKLKDWKDTEAIVVGGGFRESHIGELAIGRAAVIVKGEGTSIELLPIHNHPDDAGLIGCAHLAPSWLFAGHDAMIAVDIGGTNVRVGIIELNASRKADLAKARVWKSEIWRHADEEPSREQAIDRMAAMIGGLLERAATAKLAVAPFIGIGCPGVIEPDGSIARGSQNLPGNWESSRFHLPTRLKELIPTIGDHETVVVMHNDAVVQGLSEIPFMAEFDRWGVLTVGTGLGNARFSKRPRAGE
jgi:hypothetical protein